MSAPKNENRTEVKKLPAVGTLILVAIMAIAAIVAIRLWTTHDATVEPSHATTRSSTESFYPKSLAAPSWALIENPGVGQ